MEVILVSKVTAMRGCRSLGVSECNWDGLTPRYVRDFISNESELQCTTSMLYGV